MRAFVASVVRRVGRSSRRSSRRSSFVASFVASSRRRVVARLVVEVPRSFVRAPAGRDGTGLEDDDG